MKLVFDVDGTLYSYAETHFEKRIISLILDYMVEHLKIERAEADRLSTEYFVKYGLASTGLHRNDEAFDLVKFCRYIHNVDYSILKRDVKLIDCLQHLKDEGHDLWIMTNADMPHAVDVLAGLQVTEYFTMEGSKELKGFDCFAQWDQSEPKMQNKPMLAAYEAMHRMMDPTIPHADVAMIDDAYANLEAPHRLGWKTVWISHGREWPAAASFKPDIVVTTVHELPLVAEFAKKQ